MKDDVRGDEKRGCGRRVDNFLFAVVSSRNSQVLAGWEGGAYKIFVQAAVTWLWAG